VSDYVEDWPADDSAPLNASTLAQLDLVQEIARLVENLITFVAIDPDQPLDLTLLRALDQILGSQGQRVREAAVLAVRAQGATWDDVGSALHIAKQTAWSNYAAVAEQATGSWAAGILPGDADADPHQVAADLDAWRGFHEQNRRFTEFSPSGDPEAQVSRGLARMSAKTELDHIAARRSALFSADASADALAEMARLTEREERICLELARRQADGGRVRDRGASYAERALRAKAYAGQLRSLAEQARTPEQSTSVL
jgi:hypothetical protein